MSTPSYLGMSDEELLNSVPPEIGSDPIPDDETETVDPENETEELDTETEEEPSDDVDTDPDTDSEPEDETGSDDADEPVDPEEAQPTTGSDGEDGEEPDSTADTGKDKDAPETPEAKKDPAKEQEPAKTEVDYKAAYEQIFAPFKANGREIQVKSPEDAIALMQMGANYNKKMAALKPNLKLMKLLEKNQLLDETKLSFLIDLDKRNPEAINKLVKDSGIDPLDLNAEGASEYKPNTYAVSDEEVDLDNVLDDLQNTPTYNRLLDVVSNKWDEASRNFAAKKPEILRVINGHIESGVFDIIQAELDSERTFGRLQGMTDLEAYRQVGDAIQARGGFDHLSTQRQQNQTPAGTVVAPPPKKPVDDKLRAKKRAASSTKPSGPGTSANKDFNPLSMSDDDFEKLVQNDFL